MLTLQRGVVLAAVVAALAIPLVGCNKGGSGSSSDTAPRLDPNGNVAVVNGQPITQQEFYTDLESFEAPPQQMGGPSEPAGRSVLRMLITNLLTEQLAKKEGVYPSATDISDLFNTQKQMAEMQSVKPFDQQLQEMGITPDYIQSTRIIPQLCQMDLLAKGITITDTDIKAYYDLHKDQFTEPDRAHVKRMILASQSDAQDVYKQLQAGKSFDDLYSTRSIDKQLPNGELTTWLQLTTSNNAPQIQPLINAIAKTDPGKATPPVQFQGGWWVVDVLEKQKSNVLPLDTVKPLIKVAVLQQRIQANPTAMNQFQEDVRNREMTAEITGVAPQYQALVKQINNPPAVPQMAPAATPPPTAAPAPSAAPPGSAAPPRPGSAAPPAPGAKP